MTSTEKYGMLGCRKKISGDREQRTPRKGKKMTTMNRFEQLHSERKPLAPLKDSEWSFDFMRSFKESHKRENCVWDTVHASEL